ncbi:hypothetical protein HIM_08727 [Hirsutella minnesotensis 3608]|uniref:Amino acid permease/ SLC12A domain-containing protein n=1 Tax=Hirsutella minnesotensis 3608 TaxID=1043627 RepID=A0A0F7ZY55_9HYPO|nr:hypothetical protein HIM_08727 [Hirsutella minnesotensis 3608]
MASLPDHRSGPAASAVTPKNEKLGMVSGVYVPVFLSIMSILMFLRFGLILGQVGLVGIVGLLVVAYGIDLLTTLSLSAIASNGEVRGGGAYYLISRTLGPEFGGSIGLLFFLAQALNTAMNVVGLVDCIRLNVGSAFPQGYWAGYGLQTAALVLCTGLNLLGSSIFSKASGALLAILTLSLVSIPLSAIFKTPFRDEALGVEFTGLSWDTLASNMFPHENSQEYQGLSTFRHLFGILFPATSGIFAGASMSGKLRDPSRAIPTATLWATLTTFLIYLVVIISLAASTTHASLLANANVVLVTNLSGPIILAGECAVTFVSALICMVGSANLFQALARDDLLPGLSIFGMGARKTDEPILAILMTYVIAQVALLADLNRIAMAISMGYQMTFFTMNLACFLLKIGSAPNFRPRFKFFSWQTALLGSLSSAAAMFFIHETYASIAVCVLIFLFLLIHYLCPPKRWGDVSQNLIYHQVRKYLLRLRPEHIKFWRPHIILLINNPRRQTRLIQFCNSMKKGSLYILGHVIVTENFDTGVDEARLQQQAWTNYISETSKIKAFLQLTMSPSIVWGIRNMILSAGLGGMRPNIAVLGFYNMEELRSSNRGVSVPQVPVATGSNANRSLKADGKIPRRRRVDTSARLLASTLPTDVIRTEGMMSPTEYMVVLEDLALKYRLNVAVAHGFESLETPRHDDTNSKRYIDLWPIQMSAEVTSDGKNVLTTNFDTYTLILQLGHILHSVRDWERVYALRVMVFVEYESEVDEESARVKALLEKLRIDAQVLVFWLASGQLSTYEFVINGRAESEETRCNVNDVLRNDEWWDKIQIIRGQAESITSSQNPPQIARHPGLIVTRPSAHSLHEDGGAGGRRHSVTQVAEIPKNPDIGTLARWGVNAGIRTHHLPEDVFQEPQLDDSLYPVAECSDSEESVGCGLVDFMANTNTDVEERATQPLLDNRQSTSEGSAFWSGRGRRPSHPTGAISQFPAYGSLSRSQTLVGKQDKRTYLEAPAVEAVGAPPLLSGEAGGQIAKSDTEPFPSLRPPAIKEVGSKTSAGPSRSASPVGDPTSQRNSKDEPITPVRPSFSRQSSATRFSSRPVPETRVTIEAEGSKLGFAPTVTSPVSPRAEWSAHSRQNLTSKVVSKFVQEGRQDNSEEMSSEAERPNADFPTTSRSRHHSRQCSQYSTFEQGDTSLNIPELSAWYQRDAIEGEGSESGSAYSTQSAALSFNDLPSRAQHLILNELMRQHSKYTAVLMSTLPIPAAGTSLDEAATIQYLSDVEVLCHELPPTMMVLSNNMTVTVSL